jgi:DUF917 family protein
MVVDVRLDASNLGALAAGCAILGSGGGGDPFLGLTMALRAVEEHGPVEVIDLDDAGDADLIMPCGAIGSHAVADERIWSGAEGDQLRTLVEELHQRRVGALMCFEIGGGNGLLPVTWAARTGLPLVDADAMGRAFATLHRNTLRLAGVEAGPVVLADGRGNSLVLRAADDGWVERLSEGVGSSLGGLCAVALYCLPPAATSGAVIHGSVSRAIELGRARIADAGGRWPGARLRDALGATVLIHGKAVDLEPAVASGAGAMTIRGTARDVGRQLRLEFQSEFLLAIEDGAVRAAVPDLICAFAADSGDPVATEQLRYGQAVVVVAARAPAVWRSAAALDLVGPRTFGFAVDHVPISDGVVQSLG